MRSGNAESDRTYGNSHSAHRHTTTDFDRDGDPDFHTDRDPNAHADSVPDANGNRYTTRD